MIQFFLSIVLLHMIIKVTVTIYSSASSQPNGTRRITNSTNTSRRLSLSLSHSPIITPFRACEESRIIQILLRTPTRTGTGVSISSDTDIGLGSSEGRRVRRRPSCGPILLRDAGLGGLWGIATRKCTIELSSVSPACSPHAFTPDTCERARTVA